MNPRPEVTGQQLPSPTDSANPKSPTKPRKRARAADKDDEEEHAREESGKRARGRPRLNAQDKDETAVDRRRTQIRLAQRAYRNRKDAAISDLEKKVKDLENANANMATAFSSFFDLASAQGLLKSAPEAARRLKDLTDTFHRLSGRSSEEEDLSSDGSPSRAVAAVFDNVGQQYSTSSSSAPGSSPKTVGPGTMSVGEPSESLLDFVPTSTQLAPPNFDLLPYEVIAQPTAENASFPFYDATFQTNPEGHLGNMTDPLFFNTLPPPMSYGAHEGSFGRRLHRIAAESALSLALLQSPPPHVYAAVFGFCLLFEDRERIIQRLSTCLSSTRKEGLDNWRAPFTNLGGAGMYYPDQAADASSSASMLGSADNSANNGYREYFRPQQMTGFSMGPFDARTRSVADEYLDSKLRMLLPGFQGTFIDPSEVEKYLADRGVVIPARVEFAEADIDFNDFVDQDEGLSNMPQTMDDWGSLASGASFAYCPLLTDPKFPQGTAINKRRVRINVDLLLDEIIGQAVCLGRAPCVRVKHVNRALKVAIGAAEVTKPQDRHKSE
jgi:hypothetical protein